MKLQASRILVVCVGNICRSPVAAGILQLRLPAAEVNSAGLAAMVGHDMEPAARHIASLSGHDLPPHAARQITREMCQSADLVLCMEPSHVQALHRLEPSARGKVFLLGEPIGCLPVPDPYRGVQADFERAQDLIERSVAAWSQLIEIPRSVS